MRKGWFNESSRHALASRGIKSGRAISDPQTIALCNKAIKTEKVLYVSQLDNREDLTFVSDSQDVEAIKDYIGNRARGYDAFFVKVGDGDYDEVWGIEGIIPYGNNSVWRIK